MSQIIVYKATPTQVVVVFPTPEALAHHTITQIAKKDVPAGHPYKLMDTTELPDLSAQHAWVLDDAELTDGIGADSNSFEDA